MLLNATKFQGWAIKVKQVGKERGGEGGVGGKITPS